MSWISGLSGYKRNSTEDPREARRKKLELEHQERILRAQQREKRQKQLQQAIQAQEEADLAFQELYFLSPDIFESDEFVAKMVNFDEKEMISLTCSMTVKTLSLYSSYLKRC